MKSIASHRKFWTSSNHPEHAFWIVGTVWILEISPKTLFLHSNWTLFKLEKQKNDDFLKATKIWFSPVVVVVVVENFIFIKFSTTWNVHIFFYPNCLKRTFWQQKYTKWPILNTSQPSRTCILDSWNSLDTWNLTKNTLSTFK